jgi:ABC-type uncharacterized transport system involved in gliding motility auxiliary subunit
MEAKPKTTRFLKLSGGAIGLLVLLAILIAVNVIVGQMRVRKDFTEEKLYTLSDGTRKVLKKLDTDVTLMFFFNSSSPEVPAPIKNFAQQVEDLLREYAGAGGGHVILEKYDPKPDSDAEDLAQRYGLEGQALPQSGAALYLGLVIVAGEQQAVIPMIDPRTEQLLEYSVTRMIHRVTTAKKPVVGVLSSLPVLGTKAPPFMMPGQPRPPQQPAWAAFRDLSQDYDVRTLGTSVERIDDDVDVLVLVHPKNLGEKTLYALDQFVLRGGRLLAFVDPFCVSDTPSPEEGMGQFGSPSRSSNLDKLFDAWGLKYEVGKVVADLDAMTALRGRNNQVENSPLYLSLRKGGFAGNDVLTSSLNSMLMVMSGSFGNEVADGLKLTPLITSSEQSAPTEAMMLQFDPNAFRRQFKSGHQRLNLAVRLHGKFKTAFPDGKPNDPGDTNKVEAADSSGEHLKESKDAGNVILVADADMLNTEFCGQDINFFGFKGFQPFNDNTAFLGNTIEQLAGSAELIGIRCRGRTQRPFTRVLALQAQAQEQWMEQEQMLEQKLQATQQRMNELQSQKDEKQRHIVSPAQAKEVARFREEVLQYKKDLKNVRRNLREGIESLGMRVKLVNILLMPLLVAVAGIGFFIVRRMKTQQ